MRKDIALGGFKNKSLLQASDGSQDYTFDWRKRLSTGVVLSSVSYEVDPNSGVTLSGNTVASNVASITITTTNNLGQYWIKMTPTISSGNISPESVRLEVRKHI